ncbi:MAG: hypothetical protein QM766_18955 [Burkholderiaceae bacterium]
MTARADSDRAESRHADAGDASAAAPLTLLCPGALSAAGLPASTSIAAHWPAAWRHADLVARLDDDSLVAHELPHERWLRECLRMPADDAIEAASAALDGLAPPVIRLTPVHLHTGRDHLVLTDPEQLALSIDDARALADAVRPLLDEQGLTLTVATPLRWYLGGPAERLPRTQDAGSRQAIGRSVDAYLSRDAATRPWRRLLNEIQMTWFEHPVNEARAQRGAPAVNSVWVEGRLTATPARRHDLLLAGNAPAIRGLARLCAIAPDEPGPAGIGRWLARRRGAGPGLAAHRDSGHDSGHDPGRDPVGDPVGDPVRQTSAGDAGDAGGVPARAVLVADLWPDVDPLADPARFDAGWRGFAPWLRELGCADGPPEGLDRLDVVLFGDRRQVTLRIGRRQRWKFWRTVRPDDWLERAPPVRVPEPGDA